jgi:hypothetical protein
MTLDELADWVHELQREGLGKLPIRDTDGHELLGISRPDEQLVDEGLSEPALHIEAEF